MRRSRLLGFWCVLAMAPGALGCEIIWGLTDPSLADSGTTTSSTSSTTTESTGGTSSTDACSLPPQSCYSGPEGTENVGLCKSGTQTCEPGSSEYGPCTDEVIPAVEDCSKLGDEDCNGFSCSETLWVLQLANVQATAVASDPASGDVYVAGKFSVEASFGDQDLTPAGGDDIFLTKLNFAGDIVWTRQIGGTKSEGALGVAYGNQTVTVLGKTAGDLTVDGTVVPAGVVVVRYDTSGEVVWVASCQGDATGRLAVDPLTGDALLAGRFSQIQCGAEQYFSGGDYDLFLSRLAASDGAELDTKIWQGTSDQVATAVSSDPQGSTIFAGDSTAMFGLGAVMLPAGMYSAKVAPNGALLWAKPFGSGNVQGLASDLDGNIVAAANCQGDTNSFGGPDLPLVGSGSDVCVAKLSGVDGTEIWARRFGILGSQSSVGPIGPVAFDSKGNIAVAGQTNGALVIDGKVVSTKGFIADFEPTAAMLRWLRPLDVNVANLAFSKDDVLAVAGTFGPGTAELGTGPLTTAEGEIDTFVMMIAP